jgi:hypothetical protein
MQVQPSPTVEVDSSTYHYEDYLADNQADTHQADTMGNSASAEHGSGSIEASPPMDTEATHIGRLQAITGARAVETKVKPRGPKAEAADYDFVLVSGYPQEPCAGMHGGHWQSLLQLWRRAQWLYSMQHELCSACRLKPEPFVLSSRPAHLR